jgi:hypothetical protein
LSFRRLSPAAPTISHIGGQLTDQARSDEYEAGPYRGYAERVQAAFAAIVRSEADPDLVVGAIAKVAAEFLDRVTAVRST